MLRGPIFIFPLDLVFFFFFCFLFFFFIGSFPLLKMEATPAVVGKELTQLAARLRAASQRTELEDWVLRLEKDFPGDCGCFCLFLLNVVTLRPGEALFLAANEPHA